MKKILLCMIFLSIILILVKFRFSNYTIEYKINDFNVKTVYKKSRFYYEISKDDKIFNFDIYDKRKMHYTKIEKIEELIDGNTYCIYPTIEDTKTYPLCYVGNNYTDFHLINSGMLDNYKEEK